MSKTVSITSASQLKELAKSSKLLLANFYSESSAASSQLATVFEQLSQGFSQPKVVTFARINTETQRDVATEYEITDVPAFIYFRDGKALEKVQGANPLKLRDLVTKITNDVKSIDSETSGNSGSSSSAANWRGAGLPRGYGDVTGQVELQRCELLNVDSDGGGVRILFDSSKPSALSGGKSVTKDWVESDTDEQLMLFTPFQSMLKLHTLQITSLPPQADDDDDDDETPMRPRKIKLFTNKPHNLGFDEAEDMAATQVIELSEKDWNAEGTANIALRYVKFQNITSLVLFVVDGDGDGEKVRLDRLRLIGESGEKREMGKLEKIGEGSE